MREIVQGLATKASATKIWLALQSLGYNSRIAIVKPYLNAKPKAVRLEFEQKKKRNGKWTIGSKSFGPMNPPFRLESFISKFGFGEKWPRNMKHPVWLHL